MRPPPADERDDLGVRGDKDEVRRSLLTLVVVGVPMGVVLLCVGVLALPLLLVSPTPLVLWIPRAYDALAPIVLVLVAGVTVLAGGLLCASVIHRR